MNTPNDDPFDDEGGEAIPGGAVDVIQGNPVLIPEDDFGKMLADTHAKVIEDPEEVSRAITNRILSASTVEEILAPAEARHARELLDTPVIVTGLHFNQSDFEEGVGFYAAVDVEDAESGDRFTVTCGGRNVMAQLYALAKINAFPCKVKFTQARKPTRNGYWPLWLVQA